MYGDYRTNICIYTYIYLFYNICVCMYVYTHICMYMCLCILVKNHSTALFIVQHLRPGASPPLLKENNFLVVYSGRLSLFQVLIITVKIRSPIYLSSCFECLIFLFNLLLFKVSSTCFLYDKELIFTFFLPSYCPHC